ncbi:MAG: hypothetical protein Q3965_04095 [Rothia sp. (in: high G+C Gram-positive bacteria)]|nr:hypothetical protein [Rothia sp. (in: high G+C Gram-positive bacteria)]
MRRKLIASLSLLALALTACGSSENQEASPSDATITPAASVDSQATEKVNTLFSITPTAQQAQQVAIAKCVTEKGGNWNISTVEKQQFDIRQQLSPKPLSVDQARQHGYNSPTASAENQTSGNDTAAMALYAGNPDNGSVSVDGVPGAIAADGCLAQSYKDVFGSAEAGVLFESGILNLPLPYINAVGEDSAYSALLEEWHTCMKDTYQVDIATPDLASVDTSMDSNTLAVYDATCREKVNFEPRVGDTLDAYLTTFLTEQEPVIDQLTTAKETAEKNAPAILGN